MHEKARVSGWRPTVVVVGGFLGAGKTTLIMEAARQLKARGVRSAAVLNDQGQELVDTEMAIRSGVPADEVTDGCFCCHFSKLLEAMDRLKELRPDVIFAEPVGSCTDIAATVLAPLRQDFEGYRVAPFSVLVDWSRAQALLAYNADTHMSFLFEKQLEEADLICMTKADLFSDEGEQDVADLSGWRVSTGKPLRYLSGRSGRGVNEWLDEVLNVGRASSGSALEIDYEEYARAEAALAWLNLSLSFQSEQAVLPSAVTGELLDGLDAALTASGVSIVHLKLMTTSPTGWVKAAQCANGEVPVVEGVLDASPAMKHEVLINLRAVSEPSKVEKIVREQVAEMRGRVSDLHLACFSPAAPKPERRLTY